MMGDRPSDRRKTKTRQDIIDTAHTMIIERGVDGLSLRAVAQQIDYSPAALYRYFGSKEALIDAVRAQCFERLNAAIFANLQTATNPAEQLLIGGMTYIAYARHNPVDYHLMFYLDSSPATQGDNQRVAMTSLLYIVRFGLETGFFVTTDSYGEEAIVFHCWATVHGLAMIQATVLKDDPSAVANASEAILRKVIASFTAP